MGNGLSLEHARDFEIILDEGLHIRLSEGLNNLLRQRQASSTSNSE